MQKEFTPYQESLELKELGFDEPCFGYYNSNNEFTFFVDVRSCNTNSEFGFYPTSPTFSQVFRWFREKYKLTPNIDRDGGCWLTCIVDFSYEDYESPKKIHIGFLEYEGDEYEDAELACLRKLIEICKTKTND